MKNPDNVQYTRIKTTEYIDDSGLVETYGICCRVDRQEQGQASCQVIVNISSAPGFVDDLIDKLNTYGADPIHLQDLIEDALS